MIKFFNDIKKYKHYILYTTKSKIKGEIINSYLGSIWLFLEPLCFMLIYTFIATVVFDSNEKYFPIFVFSGLTFWNFFSKTVVSSVKLVSANKDVITKVYIPKIILLIIKIAENIFKMGISFLLILIFMIVYKVPIDFTILFIVPITIIIIIITFGISSIIMHFGVFIEDLSNITNIVMKLAFYLSGIFYSIESALPSPYYQILNYANPVAYLITELRSTMLYCSSPNLILMLIWLIIGLIISSIGVSTVYKNENTYIKVMK